MTLQKRSKYTTLSLLVILSLLLSCTAVLATVDPDWDKSSLNCTDQDSETGINTLKVTKVVAGTDPDDSDYTVSIKPAGSQEDGTPYDIAIGDNYIDDLQEGDYTISETNSHNADNVDVDPTNFTIAEGVESIWAEIENTGDESMGGSVNWQLYWIASGNPKDGSIVASGTFGPIDGGDSDIIEYYFTGTESPGVYMFRVEQRPGHPGQGELWSDSIEVASILPANPEVTVTNTFGDYGRLSVVKEFEGYTDDMTQSADFSISGPEDYSDTFTLTSADDTFDYNYLVPGDYTITETSDLPEGVEVSIQVDGITADTSTPGTVTFMVDADSTPTVTVTVTNTYTPPEGQNRLTIVKDFVYYQAGDLSEAADFELTGPDTDCPASHTFSGNGSWTLYDLVYGDYTLQELNIPENVTVTFDSDDVAINDAGEFSFPDSEEADITIYVTNTYNEPDPAYLQVQKLVTGDIPNPTPVNFEIVVEKLVNDAWVTEIDTFYLNDQDLSEPFAVAPGTYRAREINSKGAAQVIYSDESITLASGDEELITVTNNYQDNDEDGAAITVIKRVTGDNAPDNDATFDITLYKYNSQTEQMEVFETFALADDESITFDENIAAGIYEVIEGDVDYDHFKSVSYSTKGRFELGEDQEKTIIVTNRFTNSGGGGGGGGGGGDETVEVEEPPVTTPPVVTPPVVEPIVVPEPTPELPKTGASMMMTGLGLLLAGGGAALRRFKR